MANARTRARAAVLVRTSADAAWTGAARSGRELTFAPDWARPARPADRRNAERDLSVQLSGWMVLEAAATLDR